MSLQQEFIPELEVPLGEQVKLNWDVGDLETQLSVTVSSASWSVEDAAVLTLGTQGSSGDDFFASVLGAAVGCSHVIASLTTSDTDQNPTKLFYKINVIDPACGGI